MRISKRTAIVSAFVFLALVATVLVATSQLNSARQATFDIQEPANGATVDKSFVIKGTASALKPGQTLRLRVDNAPNEFLNAGGSISPNGAFTIDVNLDHHQVQKINEQTGEIQSQHVLPAGKHDFQLQLLDATKTVNGPTLTLTTK